MRPRITATGALLVLSLAATAAFGDDAVDQARAHFDAGARAEQAGRWVDATREYLRADEILANDATLRAALECALHDGGTSDAPLIAALLERSEGRSADPALVELVKRVRERAGSSIVRVSVTCGACSACAITLDGRAVAPGAHVLARADSHVVATKCTRADACVEPLARSTNAPLADGAIVDASIPCTRPAKAVEPPHEPAVPVTMEWQRHGAHPAFFFVGLGLTAVATAFTIVSGVDANDRHDDFVARGCDRIGAFGCGALANDGESAVARTNVLVAVTATLGVATTIVGAFFTGWRLVPSPRPSDAPEIGFGLGTVAIRGRF